MAQLPIDEAITRFKENEDRFDTFVNIDGTYTTNEGTPRTVQTLPSFMDEMVSRYYAYSAKGAWTTATTYEKQDLVVEGGVTYLCLLDHTSATFATDLSSGKWTVYQGLTRDELASSDAGKGAELVEYKSTTVEAALDARLPEIGTYALLRAYAGPVAAFYVRGVANIFDGGFGVFRVDASDTTSADNGGTVLLDASGRRWKRSFSGSYNVLWFGADRSGVTSSQSAYDLAKGSGNRSIYFPSGTYKVTNLSLPTYTRLHGDGYDSIIQSDGSSNHVITLNYVYHCRIDNLRIKGNAGKTNLCGIYGDGAVWTELENLIVENNGSHGIQFTDTGTPYIGSYPVMARNIHSRSNLGDGYKQVATSGTNQQNAIHISNSEFQGNAGNGLTLWGTNISVVDSISEGNTGYGIKFDNGLSSGSAYSATNIEVRGNYFEANTAGHIHARVGTYGAILGLGIEGNYISVNTGVVGIGYKAVSVDNYSSGQNLIRNLKYRKNVEGIVGTQPTVYADFGGAPNIASVVEPYYSSISTTDITTVPSRYINLGYATFNYVKSITIPGYWLAKGGSGFTYSGSTKSDAVTVDLSNTYFPLQVPIGSRLLYVSIPVESTVASYTVQMYIYQRSRDSTAGHVLTMAGSGTGALNQTVSTAVLQSYTASEDLIDVDNCDMMLRVRVNFSGGGTFYFGNPTVFYVGA